MQRRDLGEKRIKCPVEGREPLSWRDMKEREREIIAQRIIQEKHFPKVNDCENEGLTIMNCYNQQDSKTVVTEIHGMASVEPGQCAAVLL